MNRPRFLKTFVLLMVPTLVMLVLSTILTSKHMVVEYIPGNLKAGGLRSCNDFKVLEDTNSPLFMSKNVKSARELRFVERHNTLTQACRKLGHINQTVGRVRTNPHNQIKWCPIFKAGSSFLELFWTKYVNETGLQQKGCKRETQTDSVGNIVFVRNPYTRLLSGYVDKVFSVNPIYWRYFGKRLRPFSKECAHNISFAEFIEDILGKDARSEIIDRHFKPIHKTCQFCQVDYRFIGKMETLMEDVVFASDQIGALKYNSTREVLRSYGVDGIDLMFYRNAQGLFKRYPRIKKCGLTLIQCLRVTWLRWKIRGLISYKILFPVKAEHDNITFREFYELGLKAHRASDHKQLAEGKDRALREVYGTLPRSLKVRLKHFFEPDFQMFGYDSSPDFVFGHYQKSDFSFSFFDNKYN